jgi:tripartite-type tricarboxylate transporter receptor subunit TctC
MCFLQASKVFFALFATLSAPLVANAQTWPNRPIRFIVSQAAGGTPDILCRIVTEQISRRLGQQIVVENRPGGANAIAAVSVARSAPDGYTFFWATAAALVTNPHTFKSLPYDAVRDFAPVGKVAEGPFMVLANKDVSAQTLPELIAAAKAAPGKLAFATDGPRNFSGMLAAWISKLSGAEFLQIPYTAMPQGIQDVIGGRLQLAILAIPSAAPLLQQQKLHALAISTKNRAPGYQNIPPIADTFPGFDFSGWMVVVAPAGTPADIIERMNREMDSVLKEPEVSSRLAEIGFFTAGAGTPAETAEYLRVQYENWGSVVRQIGIQPE